PGLLLPFPCFACPRLFPSCLPQSTMLPSSLSLRRRYLPFGTGFGATRTTLALLFTES
ncbi:hypothetical protein E4U14_000386, partial [Claviceps sp. LM454 group G7]